MTTRTVEIISKRESYLYDGLYSYGVSGWDGESIVAVSGNWGGGYDGPSAEWASLEINPSLETLAEVQEFGRQQAAINHARRRLAELMDEATFVRKGDLVRVVAGRKVAHGTTGRIFWVEDGGYGRIGLRVDGSAEPVWSYLKNVKRADDAVENLPDLEELRAEYLGVAS